MTENNKKATPDTAELIRLRPKRPCPICSRPSSQKHHPFCSSRCADIDLHRWLGEKYTVPAVESPDFEEGQSLQNDPDQDGTDR